MSQSVLSCKSAEGNSSESEYGRVVELVDSLDSGSSVHCGRAGSSPASPTKKTSERMSFYLQISRRYHVQFLKYFIKTENDS